MIVGLVVWFVSSVLRGKLLDWELSDLNHIVIMFFFCIGSFWFDLVFLHCHHPSSLPSSSHCCSVLSFIDCEFTIWDSNNCDIFSVTESKFPFWLLTRRPIYIHTTLYIPHESNKTQMMKVIAIELKKKKFILTNFSSWQISPKQ